MKQNNAPATLIVKEGKPSRYSSYLATSQDCMARLRALKQVPHFIINHDSEAGTIRAHVAKSGLVVFSAIEKQAGGPWIVRSITDLFTPVNA